MTPIPSTEVERDTLERCAESCLRKLKQEREQGDDLSADLTQADLDGILERLKEIYDGT